MVNKLAKLLVTVTGLLVAYIAGFATLFIMDLAVPECWKVHKRDVERYHREHGNDVEIKECKLDRMGF